MIDITQFSVFFCNFVYAVLEIRQLGYLIYKHISEWEIGA